jgi:O-antigen/teichoic acid export membrane protein
LAFYAEGAAMAVTCGGLYLLLPRYGIVGAALTSSLAYSFALAVVLALFRVRLGIGLKDLLFGR